ncbi:MAG: hypothetical protein Q7T33_06970 [Dehalococcoidia bacterium]|nr:hypothetical protein [Dehalococcoidia bacterium]
MMARTALVLCAAFALLVLAACGGGDDEGSAPGASPTPGVISGDNSSPVDAERDVCALLPESDVKSITGYDVELVQPHHGPGFLHFCTIYVRVPGCDMQCALSLEDLGQIDPDSNNGSAAFRETFLAVNPETEPTFADGVLGEGSWLATATAGPIAGLKLLYFARDGIAYDLTSPRVEGGAVSEEQMVRLGQAVLDRLR